MKFSKLTKDFEKDYKLLRNQLRDYNISQVGTYSKSEPLFLCYKNEKNELIAGLYAYQSLGVFYIDLLWVDDSYRNQGLGAKLLNQAEEYAKTHGALNVRVNTASFQSVDFYLKHAYKILARVPVSIEGHKKQYDYYLIKAIKDINNM